MSPIIFAQMKEVTITNFCDNNQHDVQTECSLIPRPTNNRKHCRSEYETKLYIAQQGPIIMLDMIYVKYTALY